MFPYVGLNIFFSVFLLRINSLASWLQEHHQNGGKTQGAGRNSGLTDSFVRDFDLTESTFLFTSHDNDLPAKIEIRNM